MSEKTILIELLLAGFFAVACVRAHVSPKERCGLSFGDFFKLAGRIERLRRSRWAWFSLVGFMLVLRLQQQLPLIVEFIVLVQFALFMALPAQEPERVRHG